MKTPRSQSPRCAGRWFLIALGALALWSATPSTAAAETRPRPDYAAFQTIIERNIFNPSRAGRRTESPRETRRPARVDSFGLVGVMSYERGTFAFFDGTSTDYRKAMQAGGSLAGFQLVEVLPGAVKLQGGTNTPPTELRLGMQMRREDEGEWKVAERSESSAASGSSSSGAPGESRRGGEANRSDSARSGADASAAAVSADKDEILKRMLQKRLEENP